MNPMRPPAWLENNRPLASTTSPSSASLRSHYHQPSALNSNPWQNTLNSRMDSLPAALSLEDELECEQRDYKKDARKRIKGVRHHLGKAGGEKSKLGDDADSARDVNLAGQSQSLEQEVELSLDMNFDQLEDFVDTNAARQRLQGSTTDGVPASPPNDHRSPTGSESGLYRSPSPSQTSFAERQTSLASTADASSQFSDASLAQSAQRALAVATMPAYLPRRPLPPSSAIDVLRRSTCLAAMCKSQSRRDAELPVASQTFHHLARHA